MNSTTLVNLFEVPAERDDEFLDLWVAADDLLRAKSGYRSTKLHRAVTPDAQFRYVNVAELGSIDAWRAVITGPEFSAIAAKMAAFHPNAALYTVAIEH